MKYLNLSTTKKKTATIILPPLLSLCVAEPLAPASFNLSEEDDGEAVCDDDSKLLCLSFDPFNSLPNNIFLADFFCVICYELGKKIQHVALLFQLG